MKPLRGLFFLLLLFSVSGGAAEPEESPAVFIAEKGTAALLQEEVFRLAERYPEWGCRLTVRDDRKGKVLFALSEKKYPADRYDSVLCGFSGQAFYVSVHNPEKFTRSDAEALLSGEFRLWKESRVPVRTVYLLGTEEMQRAGQRPPLVSVESGETVSVLLKREPASVCIVPVEKIPSVGGEGIRPLAVDGVLPVPDDVASGKYPVVRFYYFSCRKDAPAAVRKLFEKVQTPEFRRKLLPYGIIQRKE